MKYHKHISQVARRIQPYIYATPLLPSMYLSQKLEADVSLKCEVLQYTNAFKVRGAMNKVLGLPVRDQLLVTASGGNHGLALAYAARQTKRKAVIFVPTTTSEYKIVKIRKLGGKVVVKGDVWDETNLLAQAYAKKNSGIFVHPFSDDDIIDGQATVAHEILQAQPDTEVIIASIGGGGLISGIARYAKSFNPHIAVYGVETKGADSMAQSRKAGRVVALPAITSIAESLAAKQVTQKTFAIVQQYVDELFTVTDDAAIRALVDTLQQEKLLTEPAASCSVAAASHMPHIKGKKVAIVLCGGNFPLERLGIKSGM